MTVGSSPAIPAEAVEATLVHALNQAPFPGLVSAYLFGSVAEGRAHRESDVDLGVLLDYSVRPSAAARFEACLRLSERASSALRRNDVDLVVMNDAPPTLSRHILYAGRRVYCADDGLDRGLRRAILSRAADLEPFLRRVRRLQLNALAR